jgi:cytochrome P450
MTATLDDQVRLMESNWFMSYPHDVYARLRREAPVYWSPRDEVWAISKYEDVRWISKNPELFSNRYHIYVAGANMEDNGQEITDDTGLPRSAELRRIAALGPMHVDNLVMADGDRHRFLRKIAGYAFTPKAINEIEAQVQRIAVELFDEIPADVELDFVDTVAAPLPMIMIALMLGVPLEDLSTFRRWSDSFIEMSEDTLPSNDDEDETNAKIGDIIEFRDYFAEQLTERLVTPRDDLLTKLTQAEWEGRPLQLEEQLSMAQVLLIAGNETTRGLIAGAGKALAEHPDQRAILVESPELMPTAVEEFLRYVTPVTHMCRTALDDVELRGQQIRRGDYLCLLYAAANRDEDAWEHGDQLDVRRDADPPQIAFGFAEHFCLGASLARREARIVLTELLARFPDYELVGDTTRTRQHMTPGIKTMPVVFRR